MCVCVSVWHVAETTGKARVGNLLGGGLLVIKGRGEEGEQMDLKMPPLPTPNTPDTAPPPLQMKMVTEHPVQAVP